MIHPWVEHADSHHMAGTIIDCNRIEIRIFGRVEIKEYDGYIARNTKTGIEVTAASQKSHFFKVGRELKELIMSATSQTDRAQR